MLIQLFVSCHDADQRHYSRVIPAALSQPVPGIEKRLEPVLCEAERNERPFLTGIVNLYLEARHDAKVVARPAHRPEQVGMLLVGNRLDTAVGEDDAR